LIIQKLISAKAEIRSASHFRSDACPRREPIAARGHIRVRSIAIKDIMHVSKGQAEPGVPEIPVPPDPTIPQPSEPVIPPLPGPDVPPIPEEEPNVPAPIEEPPLDPGAPDDPSKHPMIA
jgi:hypothetical protein